MASPRDLPPVDELAAYLDAPRAIAVAAARAVLAERREELLAGTGEDVDLASRAQAWIEAATRPRLRRVINATGVILHTNLGRAPLAPTAREAVARVAEGYSNLELDLATGARGSRHDHVEQLVCELTGAEAAMAVNNCAGATLLAAAALAGPDREVIVSRGQLVEIGGGFRVPEVIAQAGARLVEVGTTNRTRRADYEAAIGPETGAILRVHPSNFRQLGFVQEVEIEELCELGVPVIDDAGSGNLAEDLGDEPPVRRSVRAGSGNLADDIGDEPPVRRSVRAGSGNLADDIGDEPPVRRSVRAGAALVCFSGDKLLGGPQAGILAGRSEAIDAARRHPLARALRLDKLGLAALEATLRLHRDAPDEIPVLAMLTADEATLRKRAERLAALIDGAEVVAATARVGGGALPLLELPGPAVAVSVPGVSPDQLAARLRSADRPVIGRIEDGRLLLDPRTLTDDELPLVASTLA